ncbi:hypothetical protein YC2023_020086 [Brassica napus]
MKQSFLSLNIYCFDEFTLENKFSVLTFHVLRLVRQGKTRVNVVYGLIDGCRYNLSEKYGVHMLSKCLLWIKCIVKVPIMEKVVRVNVHLVRVKYLVYTAFFFCSTLETWRILHLANTGPLNHMCTCNSI